MEGKKQRIKRNQNLLKGTIYFSTVQNLIDIHVMQSRKLYSGNSNVCSKITMINNVKGKVYLEYFSKMNAQTKENMIRVKNCNGIKF